MDVFFCDLCGARVNDADLKSGQGQRSQWDVICGNCLEQGLGKEWLGKRVSARHAVATSSAPASAPSSANSNLAVASNMKSGSPAADAADRVATFDDASAEYDAPLDDDAERDDQAPPAPPAAPARVVAVPPRPEPRDTPVKAPAFALAPAPAILTAPDFSDDLDEVDAASGSASSESDAPLQATAKVSPPIPAADSQLAAAASVFSALGSNSGVAAKHAARDGDDDDLVDRAYATPAEQLSPAMGSPALGESPFGAQVHLGNPEKDETALVAALPGTAEADLELGGETSTKKSGSGTSSRRKSAKSTSNRIPKNGGKTAKGKSSRKSAPRGKDRSMMMLMIGLGLLVVIGGAFGVVMMNRGSASRTTTAAPDAETSAIRNEIKSVNQQCIAALRAKDLPQMIAARDAISALQDRILAFEASMKKQGNSDAKIAGYLTGLNTSDVIAHKKPLMDEISKRKQYK